MNELLSCHGKESRSKAHERLPLRRRVNLYLRLFETPLMSRTENFGGVGVGVQRLVVVHFTVRLVGLLIRGGRDITFDWQVLY